MEILAAIDQTLGPHLRRLRCAFVVGSGGVGKTTTAALLALGQALVGRRTLVCTVDPARRLATSLGLAGDQPGPAPVPERALRAAGLPTPLPLHAALLDVQSVMDGVLLAEQQEPERIESIRRNPFYQMLATDLEGSQAYAAMVSVAEYVQSGSWDVVVVDTPPTAHAREVFEAPYRLARAASSPFVRWLTSSSTWSGRFGLSLLGLARWRIARRAARIVGGEFLEALAEFAGLVADLIPALERRSETVAGLLSAPDTGFVVATTLAPDRVTESLATLGYLRDELSANVVGLVANRCLPPRGSLPGPAHPTDREVGARLRECLAQAEGWYADQWALERTQTERLSEAIGHLPVLGIHLADGDLEGIPDLVRLEARILGAEASRARPH